MNIFGSNPLGNIANNLLNIGAQAGLAALTGGGSLTLTQALNIVGRQAFADVAISAFNQGASAALGGGFNAGIQTGFQNGLSAGLQLGAAAAGLSNEQQAAIPDLAQQVRDVADQMGEVSRSQQELAEQFANSLVDARRDARSGSASGATSDDGEGSWLVAIAEALGKQMGEHAANMVEYANQMNDSTGGGSDPEAAREFASIQAKMQGEAQMFSISSNTMATTIKAIGEGLSAVARKQ